MSKVRAVQYLRVSTLDQSTSIQKKDTAAFIKARGWVLEETYQDKKTGTNANRPDFQRMMSAARERKFDVLVVWKFDRLFRSLRHLIQTLHEFDELGIRFVSLKDNLDLSTNEGKLMMQIIGAFSEFEASLIRERVRAGIAQAKAKGKKLGRRQRIDRDKVKHLRKQGLSLGQIAKAVGATKSAVSKILSQERLNNGVKKPEKIKGSK